MWATTTAATGETTGPAGAARTIRPTISKATKVPSPCGGARVVLALGMIQLKLDLLQTLTLAALVYFAGIQLRKRGTWLDSLNIPAAVLGGLLFTFLVFLLHDRVL